MLTALDWSRPWFDTVRPAWQRLGRIDQPDLAGALSRAALAQGLTNAAGLALRFVPQSALPEGVAYEAFIGAQGRVPTRENLHDFFNGLVWLSFPLIKRALNALQAAQIDAAGVGKARGPARDAATIFDENCALLVLRDDAEGAALAQALRAHDWCAALHQRRAAFGTSAEVCLFGHALMEKLVVPRKAITAHTLVLMESDDYFDLGQPARRARLDARIALQLAQAPLSTADFTPLPVLGIPGWWERQDLDFYQDAKVFRPPRQAKETHE